MVAIYFLSFTRKLFKVKLANFYEPTSCHWSLPISLNPLTLIWVGFLGVSFEVVVVGWGC